MQIRCHFDATILIYKHFEVFLKKRYTWKKYTIATCVKQKLVTSDENAAHKSPIQVSFPSGLTAFDTFRQLESTERYKNVSRALTYTWNGRFSDGSTDNTFRGRPKYKKYRN